MNLAIFIIKFDPSNPNKAKTIIANVDIVIIV